ncbi:glycine betaine ABC transporter substrate-binding protein [Bacillus sp. JCM 19041]|uniref:glycine betaine ABC transporter substrate-binding protein n=1 Tax=Bacillus sp. JCM 19041 TaxID=1460637 RepID=UPI0006D14768
MNWKHVGMTTSLALAVTLAACGSDDNNDTGQGSVEDEADMLSQEDIAENLTSITGIEPGSGVMTATENAIEEYNLDLELDDMGSAYMTQVLDTAISNHEPVVVTGWTPHWKFEAFDLKYLEDPENVFGDGENINTLTRTGLQEDMPEAYQVLDNFFWEPEDMEAVMLDIEEGTDERDAALNWIEDNRDTVDEWIAGVDEVDNVDISLTLVNWATEIASTNVIAAVLEEVGYNVSLTDLEPAFMFQALANGEADASVAAWLPLTHSNYMDDLGDQMEDLGPNLEGAVIGLVVPEYMDIDSIDQLPQAE